jgi:uncharacterized protein with LGFP repeats
VFGGIEEKWLSFGGLQGPLGHPVSNETPTFDGVGRFQNFQGGIVSWNPRPEMGAHVVWGLIGERWLQIGREKFGYPLTDETPASDGRGRFNHFRAFYPDGSLVGESSIFWHPDTGTHEIYGAIRDFWAQQGWNAGKLGYPINAEHDRVDGPGREQQFQHGRIIWSPDTRASLGQPSVQLRPVADPVPSIEVTGIGFTPNQTVQLGYDITGFSADGPTPHQLGEDTLTSDATGRFMDRIRVAGDITAAQARATDLASGATATGAL